MANVVRFGITSICLLSFCLLSTAPVIAQHNSCSKNSSIPYCQYVGKEAYCKARTTSHYGKIIGVSWQQAGASVGRYHRPLPKSGYCYIIEKDGKKFLMPVDKVVAD